MENYSQSYQEKYVFNNNGAIYLFIIVLSTIGLHVIQLHIVFGLIFLRGGGVLGGEREWNETKQFVFMEYFSSS